MRREGVVEIRAFDLLLFPVFLISILLVFSLYLFNLSMQLILLLCPACSHLCGVASGNWTALVALVLGRDWGR